MFYNKIQAYIASDPLPIQVEKDDTVNLIPTLLQVALIGEYQQWDLYTAYASRLKGAERESIADHFKEHAGDELGHIELLQRYLVSLGENPTLQRKPLPEMAEDATIEEIVKMQLEYEQDAVNLYTKILNCLPDNEPLKLDIEAILTKEQEHVHDLELLLKAPIMAKTMVGANAKKAVRDLLDGYYEDREVNAAKKLPVKGSPDWHKHKIALDTVKNPNKALLGGPSLEDAKKMLKQHFGYSDKDLKSIEVSAYFRPTEAGEPTKPQAGYSNDNFLTKVDKSWCAKALKELTPDLYARWHQGKLLSTEEKAFVAQALVLKWRLQDKRAIYRFLDNK